MVDQLPPTAKAFYVRAGKSSFAATALTRGPWDVNSQHAGPPAALAGYAIEHREGARPDMRIVRIVFDILRPVPIGTVHVSTTVLRAGRGVQFVEASLAAGEDGAAEQVVMRAHAVLIRVDPGSTPAHIPGTGVSPPGAAEEKPFSFPFDEGYHTAVDSRYIAGSFAQPGPATAWFRMRYPLIDGEPVDQLSRVLVAADSGNGVSQVISPQDFVFVNPELTVHLHRYPAGEWVCLDAATTVEPDGIGFADTALYDADGQIGRGTQALFVAPRT